MAYRVFQPTSMPLTPLANGMWMFESLASTGSAPAQQLSSGARAPGTPPRGNPCEQTCPLAVHSTASAGIQAGVAQYVSKDASGRSWGAPSAYGKGQCLDCPAKAAPPSGRCVPCQVRLAQALHETMPVEELERMTRALNGLLDRCCGRVREDAAKRMHALYSKVVARKLPRPIQIQVNEMVTAILAENCAEANRIRAAIASQHWDEHKDWLIGLRHLLSMQ